jgi:hypothetical protein
MNTNLFEKFRELGLPTGKYVIFGSGPMAIRGLKESNDIDAVVLPDVFEKYKNNSEWELTKIESWDVDSLRCGDIELLNGWGPGLWNVQNIIDKAEIIDGLTFVRLEEVLKWKKMMNREKDKKDVEIIENYLRGK